MEKSVLDIICASLDSFFESEKKDWYSGGIRYNLGNTNRLYF